MGWFAQICGTFSCVRCGKVSYDCIQTKLLQVNATNSGKDYGEGSEVIVDRLADFVELYPWRTSDPLRVIIGDWSCSSCNLNCQWATVSFHVLDHVPPVDTWRAVIESVQGMVPNKATAFSDVHYVDEMLAGFAAYPSTPTADTIARLRRLPPEHRVAQIAAGYQRWLHDMDTSDPKRDRRTW
jgi:hypothetical protein